MSGPEHDEGEGVFLELRAPDGERLVVVEDDGRVAYAYLVEDDVIVGDVWLYNVVPAPEDFDRDAQPMPNPRRFCAEPGVARLGPESQVTCAWSADGVELFVDGVLTARLSRGAKPGWSRGARQDGPLARPLDPA